MQFIIMHLDRIKKASVRPKSGKLRSTGSRMSQTGKKSKSGLCVRCGEPAQVHARGKRAGSYSIYCLRHLLEQREKNRARGGLNRWIQSGGDPAAWAAVAAWKAGGHREYWYRGFNGKPQTFKSRTPRHETSTSKINMKFITKLLVTVIIAAFCGTIANAQYSNALMGATLIYSNGFDGSGTVNITNTPADQEFNLYGGPVVTTNWVDLRGATDTNQFNADGSVGTEQADTIVLPFTPVSNHVYALQATVTLSGNPGTWVAAGFDAYNSWNNGAHYYFNGNGGWDWALINYSGSIQYFLGQSTGAGQGSTTVPGGSVTHVLTLILDTTFYENSSNRWIAQGYCDGFSLGHAVYSSNPTILGLGYGQYATISAPQNIRWNSFTLTANQELIIQQPTSQNIDQGGTFTDSVLVGGTPPFYYQWYSNGVALVNGGNISGATTNILTITSVVPGDASTNYYCVVTNVAYGAVTSAPAILSINSSPEFTTADPITFTNLMTLFGGTNDGVTTYAGSSPSFLVSASGKQPIAYYWLTNGVAVGGANGTTFTFQDCQWNSPTNFSCIASNSLGTATNTWAVQYIPPPTAPYPQAVIAAGAIGYWRLDETNNDPNQYNNGEICDDFISGNNGIYTNTALYQPGYNPGTDPSEKSAEFGPYDSGTSCDANSIGTNVDFSASSNAEFTVSVWANGGYGYGGTEPDPGGIVSKGYFNGEEFSLDDGAAGGDVRFEVRNGAATRSDADSTVQLGANNSWNHLVGVCDESNGLVSLYINGILQAQASITPGSGVQPDALIPIMIGARSTSASTYGDNQFEGALDDVAIFNYAMSDAQVGQLYGASGGVVPPYLIPPMPRTNLVFFATNTTVTIPATAYGTPPCGYYWTNLTTGSVIASGVTNVNANLNATVTIPLSTSVASNVLELVVTNATGSTNWFVNLVLPPTAQVLNYSSSILYSNAFSGSLFGGGNWPVAGAEPDDINSLLPTNTTWTDALGTNDPGSLWANGVDESLAEDSWLLPFTPEPGYVYTLTATLTWNAADGGWMGLGFAQSIPNNLPSDGRFTLSPSPNGYDWIILTETTGNAQYFPGPNTSVASITNATLFTAGTGAHTVQVVLNTTGPQWGMAAYVDGVPAGTNTYASKPTIGAIGLTQTTQTSLGDAQWSDFSLTQVAPGGVPPYLLVSPPTNNILLTNATVTLPATAFGSTILGFSWLNNSTVVASGTTNTAYGVAPLSANLSIPSTSLSAGQLELVVTNAYGTNITSITLVSPINPSPTNIVATVTNNNLYLTWPTDHTGWQLQAQTNSVSVGISTNWVNVSGSTLTNQVVVPINLTNGAVFYRLTYHP